MNLKKLCESLGEAYERGLLEEGVLLVSYPASGELLLREVVAQLLYYPEEVSTSNVGFFVPSTDELPFERLMDVVERRRWRVIHTYLWYVPFRGKVIYLVDRPQRVLRNLREFVEEAEDFMMGRLGFPSWDEHVGSWLGAMEGKENFLLVRAEDLGRRETVERIADFTGASSLPLREERIYRSLLIAGKGEEEEGEGGEDFREVFGRWMREMGWL